MSSVNKTGPSNPSTTVPPVNKTSEQKAETAPDRKPDKSGDAVDKVTLSPQAQEALKGK